MGMHPSTQIMTKNGYISAKTLFKELPLSKVWPCFTDDGIFQTGLFIENVYNKNDTCYKITFSNGFRHVVTADTLYTLIDGSKMQACYMKQGITLKYPVYPVLDGKDITFTQKQETYAYGMGFEQGVLPPSSVVHATAPLKYKITFVNGVFAASARYSVNDVCLSKTLKSEKYARAFSRLLHSLGIGAGFENNKTTIPIRHFTEMLAIGIHIQDKKFLDALRKHAPGFVLTVTKAEPVALTTNSAFYTVRNMTVLADGVPVE